MNLREILNAKGNAVHTISANFTLADVVNTLVRHNCGSLVVCEAGSNRMSGIITERDILRAAASHPDSFMQLRVADAMTSKVATGSPADSVEDTMGLMTQMRIRHLPVTDDEQLVGIVSIGDVVKYQHDRLTMENHYLKSYIQG